MILFYSLNLEVIGIAIKMAIGIVYNATVALKSALSGKKPKQQVG